LRHTATTPFFRESIPVESEHEFFDGQGEVCVLESCAGKGAAAKQAAADLGHGGYLKVESGTRHAK
jgi:hypothetical protein